MKADCGKEGENWKDLQIAEAFDLSVTTVERVRKSLVEEGFEGTINSRLPPHSNRERIIKGEEEVHLIALTWIEPREGHAKRTLRLLADRRVECKYAASVSTNTIGRALKRMVHSSCKKG